MSPKQGMGWLGRAGLKLILFPGGSDVIRCYFLAGQYREKRSSLSIAKDNGVLLDQMEGI